MLTMSITSPLQFHNNNFIHCILFCPNQAPRCGLQTVRSWGSSSPSSAATKWKAPGCSWSILQSTESWETQEQVSFFTNPRTFTSSLHWTNFKLYWQVNLAIFIPRISVRTHFGNYFNFKRLEKARYSFSWNLSGQKKKCYEFHLSYNLSRKGSIKPSSSKNDMCFAKQSTCHFCQTCFGHATWRLYFAESRNIKLFVWSKVK